LRYRYHTAKGLPDIPLPEGIFPLTYSLHALERAQAKGIWQHRLPAFLDTRNAELVDIEVQDQKVTATAYRQHWTKQKDLVLACQVNQTPWLVRTLYINAKLDRHPTLNLDPYCTPGEEHLWNAASESG
jgi:hypothetical protein